MNETELVLTSPEPEKVEVSQSTPKGTLDLRCCDCMELMKEFPDGHFDLAIVDPPYGIGASEMRMGKGKNQQWKQGKGWDDNVPNSAYFAELWRISKKQIIWGGNYFLLPCTGGWLFWDKARDKDVSFADGELAWTSFLTTLKKVTVRYDGFIGSDIERIHPTQKPVALYRSLLEAHAEPGQRILDTHLGSGSHAIACHYFGAHLTASEIDPDYFREASARIKRETAQQTLF